MLARSGVLEAREQKSFQFHPQHSGDKAGRDWVPGLSDALSFHSMSKPCKFHFHKKWHLKKKQEIKHTSYTSKQNSLLSRITQSQVFCAPLFRFPAWSNSRQSVGLFPAKQKAYCTPLISQISHRWCVVHPWYMYTSIGPEDGVMLFYEAARVSLKQKRDEQIYNTWKLY